MTHSNAYFPRNPKFTDTFERELANDDASHLSRNEPSVFMPLLKRLGRGLAALARAVRFLRASAQRPEQRYQAS
jgi:hypothetical protein